MIRKFQDFVSIYRFTLQLVPIETLTLFVALKKQALYLFSHCAYYFIYFMFKPQFQYRYK